MNAKFIEIIQQAHSDVKIHDEYLAEIFIGDKSYFVKSSSHYPLNKSSSVSLVQDKTYTYKILEDKGYKIPKTKSYHIKKRNGFLVDDTLKISEGITYPCIIKPNKGSKGEGVRVLHNNNDLENQVKTISLMDYIAIVQEIVKGDEYRIFIVDGDIKFSYLKSGGEIKNLSREGQIEKLMTSFTLEINNWAKKISEDFNLRILGIDLITPDFNPENFIILEINSNPNLTGIYDYGYKELAINIQKEIIEKFKLEN